MKKGVVKKSIVLGIIMLFVGAGVIQNINTIVKADLTNGLVGYWSFNNGTATDNSGNGHDGTVYGATVVSGKFGNAFHFNGDNDYIDIGDNSAFDITGNITIALWFKTDTSQLGTFVSKLDPQNPDNGYNLVMGDIVNTYPPTSAGTIYFMTAKDSANLAQYDISQTTSTYTDNVWHLLTAIYTPDGVSRPKIYIDAVEQSVSNYGTPLTSMGASPGYNLKFGEYSYGSGYHNFNGSLDEVRIYNRVLTTDEIQSLFQPNVPPVADFIFSPTNPTSSEMIQFTDTSTDADGTIVGWWWDFGDNYFSNLQNPMHCYHVDGTYTVGLTVTDNGGASNSIVKTIVVSTPLNNAPNIPSKPCGLTVGLTKIIFLYTTNTTDPDNDLVFYRWNWGDNSSTTWIGPYGSGILACGLHKWTKPGTYKVKVKAKDVYGAESDWSSSLTVKIFKC